MTSKRQIRAALYTRVSAAEQATSYHSTKFQEKETRDFCSKQGYVINERCVYEDMGTWGTSITEDVNKRPAFKKLLKDAKAKMFDVIVVFKSDRVDLFREHIGHKITKYLNECGIVLKDVVSEDFQSHRRLIKVKEK